MARPCPACSRPNGDRALKCLYCAAPLPEVEEAPQALPAETLAKAGRHLIILAPHEELPQGYDGKVDALARATALSLYDARLALNARRYRLLRKVETAAEADALCRRAREGGLVLLSVKEGDLDAIPLQPFYGASFEAQGLVLRLGLGEPAPVPYDDVLLLVKGEIVRERFEEKRLATNRAASQKLTPSYRLHLYGCTSGVFDLDPETFDWTALGNGQTSSLYINLEALVAEVRKRSPRAEIDDRFGSEPVVLTRREVGNDPAAMLAQASSKETGVVHDNEPQFRYYARWRYLVELEQSSSKIYTGR